jgi:hypothetical protein
MRPGTLARSIVVPGSSSSRSFSPLKVSQKYSQLIHTRSCFFLASGLRLEIAFKIDKKKSEKKEFYFSSRTKIFLTRKRNTRVRGKTKNNLARGFVRDISRRCSEGINRFTSPWGRYSRFDRIDPCTQFSRLQSGTEMPIKNAGDAHEDEKLADEVSL